MTDRNKPTAGIWITVALVAALAYPLSIGPAIWLSDHKAIPTWAHPPIEWFYSPIECIAHNAPDPIRAPLFWYGDLWRSKS